MTAEDVVSSLWRGARGPWRETASVRTAWTDLARAGEGAFACAVRGGVGAPTPGFAFAIGYEAALHAMFPTLAPGEVASLCVTEAGGGHPKAITSQLDARPDGTFVLEGTKRWSTMAPVADTLFVLAHTSVDAAGRKAFRLVRVPAARAGITCVPLPPTPFAPEVPHAEMTFAGVAVAHEERLEGDGFERYVKPFRTVEDLHVVGALLAWLTGVWVRTGHDAPTVERLMALLVTLDALSRADAAGAETHLALAGTLGLVHAVLDAMEPGWTAVPEDLRTLWARDRALLGIARSVREQRTTRAWSTLSSTVTT